MQVARRALGNAKLAIVIPGAAPLIRTQTLRAMVAAHRAANAAATVLSAVVSDPSGYGRIVRKSETQVAAIAEESQLTEEQRDINEINSSIYCFSLDKLWPALAQVKPNNKHREIYLTDAVGVLAAKGENVLAQVAPDAADVAQPPESRRQPERRDRRAGLPDLLADGTGLVNAAHQRLEPRRQPAHQVEDHLFRAADHERVREVDDAHAAGGHAAWVR